MDLHIKPFTGEDIDFAVSQAKRENWATGRRLFELHLEYDPDGAFIAWESGKRVGMATATKYATTGWIGNLIVVPDYRNRGIGSMLMEKTLGYLESTGIRTIRLDADPPGIPLYKRLGFEEEIESRRYKWEGAFLGTVGSVEQLSPDNIPDAVRLDAKCFGDNRDRLLHIMFDQAESAIVVRSEGRMVGFLFVTDTTMGLRIGPCCAENPRAAEALLTSALGRSGGRPVTLGIPAVNRIGCRLLLSLGFRETPPCLRMVRGDREAVGELDRYFAISGGAIG